MPLATMDALEVRYAATASSDKLPDSCEKENKTNEKNC